MMSDEQESNEVITVTGSTEEDNVTPYQQDENQESVIELIQDSNENDDLPHSSIRQSNRQKHLKKLSLLTKDFKIKMKRVPCLLKKDCVNVTCDRCSIKFTSLSKFLTHLHPKFKVTTSNINNNNNNNKKNKSKQSILKSSFNENLNYDDGGGRRKKITVKYEADALVGDDYNDYFENLDVDDDFDVDGGGRNKRKRTHVKYALEDSDGDEFNDYFDVGGGGGGDDYFMDNYNEDDNNIPQFNVDKKPPKEKEFDPSKIMCSHCPRSFKRQDQVDLHIKICHSKRKGQSRKNKKNKRNNNNDSNEDNEFDSNDNNHIEEVEDSDSDASVILERGRIITKKEKPPPKPKKVKVDMGPVMCETCGKVSKNVYVHREHLKMHLEVRPHVCTHPGCTLSFKRPAELKRHAARHEKIRDHICHICAKAFYVKCDLESHLRTHGEKKFKCDHEGCKFATTNGETLKKHVQYVHFGERSNACPVCDKSFKRIENLKLHMFHHTDTKPVSCKVEGCQWTAFSYRAKQNHERTKHLGLPPLPRWKKPKKTEVVEPGESQNEQNSEQNNEQQQNQNQNQNPNSILIPSSFEDFQYDI